MPELRPFKGIRYSDAPSMGELVCPPYDVISPEEQERLHDRHPANAVRLELARADDASGAKYSNVFETFRGWLSHGTLDEDATESFYVYRQDFVDGSGDRRRVAGVLGALELEAFGSSSGVLPHERTMPGPKEDRLALMRACPVNISPIYAIYRGDGGLRPFLDSLEHRPTAARFAGDGRILHRLWTITAPAELEMVADALRPGPLVIADGHHRYETALAFQAEQDGPGGHDSMMCFCVDADSEELVVLPYNRAVKTNRSQEEVAAALEARFNAQDLPPNDVDVETELGASGADHPFVAVLEERAFLVEVSDEQLVERVGQRHEAWRSLDVVALHEALFPEVFGEDASELMFSKDPAHIVGSVRSGAFDVGFLLRAMAAADVVDVASSGERMPQKASYFWPKAVTGLVFRSLR